MDIKKLTSNKNTALLSIVLSVVIGAVIAFALYKASDEFFSEKRKQTMVKTTELGASSSGEVVFPIGAVLPNIKFKSISGGAEYDMASDKNSIKIINFWASWCEPCVEEFSSFARLLNQVDGNISFIGVSEDKTLSDAKDFLTAFDSDFKNLKNVHFGFDLDKEHSKKYGLLALPESFIVDANNKLIRRVSGFEQWDAESAIAYFNRLLDEQKALNK